MSRRRAREAAMQALFQLDMNPPADDGAEAQKRALDAAWRDGKDDAEQAAQEDGAPDAADENRLGRKEAADYAYAWALLSGTRGRLASIDETLSRVSQEWKLSRMAGIDRSILRLAAYELACGAEVTPGIVINEAVELAKRFGTDQSGRFVNGVLGTMVRQ